MNVKISHEFISNQKYYAIPLELLSLDEICDRDLYVEMGKTYVLYRAAHTPFREHDLQRLIQSRIKSLYICCHSEDELQQFYQDRLQTIIASPNVSSKEKATVISLCALKIAKDSFEGLPIRERLPQAEKLVTSTVTYVTQDLDNIRLLIGETREQPYLLSHSINVMTFSVALLAALKVRDHRLIHETGMGAFFHDIGKTKIDRDILEKPSRLSDEEWALIRKHPQNGYEILSQNTPERARSIVFQHHERLNGKGYPRGLSSEGLPMPSRIVSICDAYDAMTSNRCYQKAIAPNEAFRQLIVDHADSFDRKILIAFIETLNLKA